jgi:hypothetical protein
MEGIRKAMNERNLTEGQWEDRKQWSLGVGQRRKTFWNRYTYILYHHVSKWKNSTFCWQSVFMCLVWFSEQTALILVCNINRIIVIITIIVVVIIIMIIISSSLYFLCTLLNVCCLISTIYGLDVWQCISLLNGTECERYWEARIKMMENWLCFFLLLLFLWLLLTFRTFVFPLDVFSIYTVILTFYFYWSHRSMMNTQCTCH